VASNLPITSGFYAIDLNGVSDVFVHDRQTGQTSWVSSSQGDGGSHSPSISSDGMYVAFQSLATNLIGAGNDTNGVADIFVRDFQTGTTRVSISSAGVEADGVSRFPSVSSDGRYVAFDSDATNLVDDDNNSARDVFVRDRGE
jgi:Tol biopolymer transport system component